MHPSRGKWNDPGIAWLAWAVLLLIMVALVQAGIRLLPAGGTLWLCRLARERRTAEQTGVWLYALPVCYLRLFNPRTENNTYAMLGPAIAAFCGQALLVERRPKVVLALVLSAIGILEATRSRRGSRRLRGRSGWLPSCAPGFSRFLHIR